MYINLKTFLRLPVYTISGTLLGRVHDLEFDAESHHVRHYIVEPHFFGKEYFLITPGQIKEITLEKILVDDAVNKFKKGKEEKEKASRPALGGVSPTNELPRGKPTRYRLEIS